MLEGVAISSSRESSQPRHWTQISRISGRFFTVGLTREYWKLCQTRLLPFWIHCLGFPVSHCSHMLCSDWSTLPPNQFSLPATSISAYVLNCYLCFQTLLKNPFFMRIFQIPSIIFKKCISSLCTLISIMYRNYILFSVYILLMLFISLQISDMEYAF